MKTYKAVGTKNFKLYVESFNRVEQYTQDNRTIQRVIFFNCLCDCGNKAVIRQASLKNTQSCGCQRIESNRSRRQDIAGQKFTRLTVISREQDSQFWKCLCDCGSETLAGITSLRNGDIKSCGCWQKDKAGENMLNMHKAKRHERGLPEDIPMSTEYNLERLEFKPLSAEILKRDLFTCAWCSQKSGELNVHHLDTWIRSPELRFTPTNLVTLCVACHKNIHKDGNSTVDPYMTILLQGYSNVMEDSYSARIELTPN